MNQQPSTNNYQLKSLWTYKNGSNSRINFFEYQIFWALFLRKITRFVLNHLSLEEISEINHQGKVGVFVNETIEKLPKFQKKQNSILFNCMEMKMKNLF